MVPEGEGTAGEGQQAKGAKPGPVKADVPDAPVGRARRMSSAELEPCRTPEADTVVSLAAKEAAELGDLCIGPEHLLLGILGEGKSAAAKVLAEHGLSVDGVRQELAKRRG